MENSNENKQFTGFRPNDVIEIDLKEVFFLLLHSWKSILLAALIGAAVLGAYRTFLVKPSYKADASIYITNSNTLLSVSDLQLSSILTDDYTAIIKSRTVLNEVIDRLELNLKYDELSRLIEISQPNDTRIIKMAVTCNDPELCKNIVNALMNVSISQINQIVGGGEPTVIDYSEASAVLDVTSGLSRFLIMGAFIGALIVCAVVILRMLLDNTLKNEEDVEKYLQLPVLAAVPYYQKGKRNTKKAKKRG